MTRLIDADQMKENIIAPRSNGKALIEEWINAQPTVDAVPVEYIEQFIEKHKWVGLGNYISSADSANRSWVMKEFLKEWRREHDKAD